MSMFYFVVATTTALGVVLTRHHTRLKRRRSTNQVCRERKKVLLEVCCETIQSVATSLLLGVDRVELCSNLPDGGTTPSAGFIQKAVQLRNCTWRETGKKTGVNVLIRPRGGDFVYSPDEVEIMLENIAYCKRLGCDAVVVGALTLEGEVDMEVTQQLVSAATPMLVTFHRAIDMARDPVASVEEVIACGCDKILTSGGAACAMKGAFTIKTMANVAAGRIGLIGAGGVSEENVLDILQACGGVCKELHGSLRTVSKSPMLYRKENVWMGGNKINDANTEYIVKHASSKRLSAILKLLRADQK